MNCGVFAVDFFVDAFYLVEDVSFCFCFVESLHREWWLYFVMELYLYGFR